MKTLRDYLLVMDLTEKGVDKICEEVLNSDDFKSDDHVTMIVIDAFNNSEYGRDLSTFKLDLSYAISQLMKVREIVDK
jgi:hypothetical protein